MGSSYNRALYKCPITLLTYFTRPWRTVISLFVDLSCRSLYAVIVNFILLCMSLE